MKKLFNILLIISVICLLSGCSQNKQNYNLSQNFKNKAISVISQIDSNSQSNNLETEIESFVKNINQSNSYTKDEKAVAEQIFNYYGQTVIVEKAKSISDEDYNKQKSVEDTMRNKINQYLN